MWYFHPLPLKKVAINPMKKTSFSFFQFFNTIILLISTNFFFDKYVLKNIKIFQIKNWTLIFLIKKFFLLSLFPLFPSLFLFILFSSSLSLSQSSPSKLLSHLTLVWSFMGHGKQFGLANENQLVIMFHTNLTFPFLLPLNSSGSFFSFEVLHSPPAHLCCPIFNLPQ